MPPKSSLHFPPPELASCLSMGIERDTRGACLNDAERLNYFPATPLVALSIVMQGQLRLSAQLCDLAQMRDKPVLGRMMATAPQSHPFLSWSDGDIHAITIAFFPEAWLCLGGKITSTHVPGEVARAASVFLTGEKSAPAWDNFCATLLPIWLRHRNQSWAGSHRIADWARHLAMQAALSGAGQTARSFERRIKRWTGQSRQALSGFARLEDLYALHLQDPKAGLAEIATDARFSDQSHMGRSVKKLTGFSPARLNHLIETNEAFWCYRLLGERL